MNNFFDWVQEKTENHLTNKKAQKETYKRYKSVKTEVLDWINALVFAVVVVLLLNLYFLQFFVIPTPSMVSTLDVGSRVYVNKQAYGVEPFLGGNKIFDLRTPDRDDIITFYNPTYESKGPVFDTLSTLLFMASFSLINIDVDENGNMREKLYVKRTVGVGGDTIKVVEGNVFIKPSGTNEFIDENTYREENNLESGPHRSVDQDLYPSIKAMGQLMGYQTLGITGSNVPTYLIELYQELEEDKYYDMYELQHSSARLQHQILPEDFSKLSEYSLYENGIYVPFGRVLPMGDNRDNSQDGRYFGPVSNKKVNGKVNFIFWPLNKIRSFV